ncbi:hypothetical protein HO133_009512 [Letharia lupina]|uniref:Ankyrin n=1 Tax=Letharia lupina TaxID=560253 RepID=A0A8H6CL20_9LECA|nr:uncharacterized protein HO133_009512 [Letharia lupina]KAF6225512.1 hypothetical protein HO133_009512 [Letharia lupina]
MQPGRATIQHGTSSNPSIEPTTAASLHAFAEACANGNMDTAAILATGDDHYPNTQYYLNHGLLASIIHKQLPIARFLLSHGATITPSIAMAAVRGECIPIFELLLEKGWDVNSPVTGGQPALSAFVKNEALLKWFLDHGADPNLGPPPSPQPDSAPVPDSGSTLDCAASAATPATFDLLLQHGAKLENSQALHMAAASQEDAGRIPMMEYLLRKGCDINAGDEARGFQAVGPPLFYAIRQGQVQKVRWLLAHGADARVEGRGGATALRMAEQTGMGDVIAMVKEALERVGSELRAQA